MNKNKAFKIIGASVLAFLMVLPLSGCSMRDARAWVEGQDASSTGLKFKSPFQNLPDNPNLSNGYDKKAGANGSVGDGSAKKSQAQKNNSLTR